MYFNDSLQRNKAFRNPHILSKLVEYVDVDEMGSNFPRNVWDSKGMPPDAYASAIGSLFVDLFSPFFPKSSFLIAVEFSRASKAAGR
jgi:hypothetical protein